MEDRGQVRSQFCVLKNVVGDAARVHGRKLEEFRPVVRAGLEAKLFCPSPGKDAFHHVPFIAAKVRDAVERVLTGGRTWGQGAAGRKGSQAVYDITIDRVTPLRALSRA